MSAPKRVPARHTRKPFKAEAIPWHWAGLPPWKSLNISLPEMTEFSESLGKVRKKILAYSADKAFDELVKRNCDPHFLLCQLATVAKTGPDVDREAARFGFERRQLVSIARRMRRCANEMGVLDKKGFLRFVGARPYYPERFSFIPRLLRGYAHALEAALGNPLYKPRARAFHNTALAQLVAYVQHCTGTPHDNEVSALLNALGKSGRDGDPYTADALKTWRGEHKDFIRHNRDLILPLLPLLPAIGR